MKMFISIIKESEYAPSAIKFIIIYIKQMKNVFNLT